MLFQKDLEFPMFQCQSVQIFYFQLSTILIQQNLIQIKIAAIFEEYFTHTRHEIFQNRYLPGYEEENSILTRAFRCTNPYGGQSATTPAAVAAFYYDSSACCLPCSCVTLAGNRRLLIRQPTSTLPPLLQNKIRRLFFADALWLFFMERMGSFKIIGTLLDDFATNGKYPIDIYDISSTILNTWVELTKMGISSIVKDRESDYIRSIGWKQTDLPRKTDPSKTVANTGMSKLLINFVSLVLEFYRQKQTLQAIQGTLGTPPSGASTPGY